MAEWPVVEEAIDEEKLVKLQIVADQEPLNPRKEYENAAVMLCSHRNYNLGDEQINTEYNQHVLSHISSHSGISIICDDCLGELEESSYENRWDHIGTECEFEPHTSRLAGTFSYHCKTHHVYVVDEEMPEECGKACVSQNARLAEGVSYSPLYLMDHSGISISMDSEPFRMADSQGWDWGCVGIIYLKHSWVRENWPNIDDEDIEARAFDVMKAEVDTYDDYLTGNIYGFVIEKGEACDHGDVHWEVEESVWGFHGTDYKTNGMIEHVPDEYKNLFEELES